MPRETYAKARERLLYEATQAGLTVQTRTANGSYKLLKAPRITLPNGRVIELRKQSCGLVDGLSSWIDYRGMSLGFFCENA